MNSTWRTEIIRIPVPEMTLADISGHIHDNEDATSNRSRASSVVSTGTKTSIGTMGTFLSTTTGLQPFTPLSPPEPQHTLPGNSIDVLLGRRNFRISARPGSILSISSYDVPAPPYHEAIKAAPLPIDYNERPSERLDESERERQRHTVSWNQENEDISRPTTSDTVVLLSQESEHEERQLTEFRDNTEAGGSGTYTPSIIPFSPLDSESARNAISRHYTEIVRQIDGNHQNYVAQLRASHDAQLTEMEVAHEDALDSQRHELEHSHEAALADALSLQREELEQTHARKLAAQRNEIDNVYRKELASERRLTGEAEDARTDLEQRIGALKEDLQTSRNESTRLVAEIERLTIDAEERERIARNQVEDLWEGRWKQRMALAAEQMAKAERDVISCWDAVEERFGCEVVGELRLIVKEKFGAFDEAAKRKPSTPKKIKWPSFDSQKSLDGGD